MFHPTGPLPIILMSILSRGRVDQFNLFVDQQILINFLSIIRKDKVAGGQDRGPWISDVKIYSDLRKWNQSRPYNITHYTLHGTECPSAAAVLRNVNKQLLVQTRCRVKSSSVVTVGSSGGQFPYNSYDYPHYPPPASRVSQQPGVQRQERQSCG